VVPYRADNEGLTWREREQAIEDERELLTDNHFLDPATTDKRQRRESHGPMEETTSLLRRGSGGPSYNAVDAEDIDRKWEEAVMAGLIRTTWRREAIVIGKNAAPLVVTFLLQYSLTVASIFTLGHLGKKELGAVSLASMTASITGYAGMDPAFFFVLGRWLNNFYCSLPRLGDESGYSLCPSLWLWEEKARGIANAENGLLSMGYHYSNRLNLVLRRQDPAQDSAGKRCS
jgi:hypothetical protein